ncbi:zinc finger protein 831 [Echinops telfairi]|uniref:Zinc finger protein 831 n=1 Tax=Echinops telfairi TaxID=9371 RepID=A0AC55DM98_ECHTE|nr:zinc finger protein 831 [Echinops telfairi]
MWDGDRPARDQPAPGPPGTPSGQASPRLTLGPILLPGEQGLAPAMLLKALPIPLYHMVSPGAPQPRAALGPSGLDGASLPFILSPLLRPEGPGPVQVGKAPAPVLTVSLVGALPVLSPGPGPSLGSPGRVRSAGRYLCPHCGRDCLKPSVLEKHIRSHTGERPFPCATCGIAFKTQSNLYKHRRTQTHLNNARRPSESDEADRADSQDPKSGRASADGEALRKLPDEQSPTASAPCPLQRQQASTREKGWEGRLRKCESSDSGYLSRSDSAEQPPAPTSPLRSQSEAGSSEAGSSEPGPAGELGKRQLEERIARLISHNQAVMDDAQLDTVRPRKTVLSKQGSIDLPMPYTYRDSFHFDMRALEPGRRRLGPLGPAGAPCTPPDKARPLSFHSVPTQLSTTAQCVSVTRSNSLPFLEGTHTWREWAPDPQEAGPHRQRLGGPRPSPARLDRSAGPVLSAVPSSHHRALVRQAAVEDLPGMPSGETTVPTEVPPRSTAGDGAVSRGRATGKRLGQRRLKLFSQEKWQVYGDETFRRIYRKGKAGHCRGQQAGEDPSAQAEPARAETSRTPVGGDTKTTLCGDTKTPGCGDMRTPVSADVVSPADVTSGSELGPQGGRGAESCRAPSGGHEEHRHIPPQATSGRPPLGAASQDEEWTRSSLQQRAA